MTFFFKNFKSGDRKLTLRKKGPLHTLRAPEIEVQVPQRKKESWIPEFKKECPPINSNVELLTLPLIFLV